MVVFGNTTPSSLSCNFQILPTQYLPHFPRPVITMTKLSVTFQTENTCKDGMLTVDSCLENLYYQFWS